MYVHIYMRTYIFIDEEEVIQRGIILKVILNICEFIYMYKCIYMNVYIYMYMYVCVCINIFVYI
jgi:hypothetical protein